MMTLLQMHWGSRKKIIIPDTSSPIDLIETDGKASTVDKTLPGSQVSQGRDRHRHARIQRRLVCLSVDVVLLTFRMFYFF